MKFEGANLIHVRSIRVDLFTLLTKVVNLFCLNAFAGNINGISNIQALDVNSFPNPCYGDITLTWEGGDQVADVVVFDQLGKKAGVFLNVTQGQKINLNVSAGMYNLNIRSDNHTGSITVDVLSE